MISPSYCKQGLWNTSAEEVCKLMESLLVWNQSSYDDPGTLEYDVWGSYCRFQQLLW